MVEVVVVVVAVVNPIQWWCLPHLKKTIQLRIDERGKHKNNETTSSKPQSSPIVCQFKFQIIPCHELQKTQLFPKELRIMCYLLCLESFDCDKENEMDGNNDGDDGVDGKHCLTRY